MAWVAYLGECIQPKMIKSYLTHVKSLHVDADLPFSITEAPIVQRLIRGIKRYHGEAGRKPKQPITLPILCTILSNLPNSPQYLHLQAAYCVAYSALLRCGEFTIKGGRFDPTINLMHGAVHLLPDAENPTHATLVLPTSKTDPFHRGVTITITAAPPNVPTCPVQALKDLFRWDPHPENVPLFEESLGNALSQGFFLKAIRQALLAGGHDPSAFASHSFRRGATSSTAVAGFSDYGALAQRRLQAVPGN
ncbi:hypothetical protein EW146_g8622 [Bondarzewia mesenterica]|uniref:Tyr recombinase domain-containing protein n=1 Tax=Bondarzewia mesenterica TaxID=1095465 RepID=A0A4S4LDE4_9AGAM|nr:hypothetical protein EW146_g8622 [Bondarzewia mesenterica]